MAVKIYISGNALRAENTSISLSLLDVPKKSVYFFNQALNNGFVKIGYLPLDNNAQPLLEIDIADAVDENLVAFTAETFRVFCDTNLGFHRASVIDGGIQPDGDYVEARADGQFFQTTVNLAAGASFTSDWFDTNGFGTLEFFFTANVPSENKGIFIEFTDDTSLVTPLVRSSEYYEFSPSDVRIGYRDLRIRPKLDGFRLTYINGSEAQTDVYISSTGRIRPEVGLQNTGNAQVTASFEREVALGNVSNYKQNTKFGRNGEVDSGTAADIWGGGRNALGIYNYTGFNATANEDISTASSSASDVGTLVVSGTVTTSGLKTIIDSGATFVTNRVAIGDIVLNDTRGTYGYITSVDSETQVTVFTMLNSVIGEFDNILGNTYRIARATSTGAAVVSWKRILNSDFERQTNVFVILNGTTLVNTTVDAYRLSRGKVLLAGSTGNNVGEITCRQVTTTANIFCVMQAGSNQTLIACDTVPKDTVYLLESVVATMSISGGHAASGVVSLRVRPFGGVFNTERIYDLSSSSGEYTDEEVGGIALSPGTDFKLRVDSTSANNVRFSGKIEYLEIDEVVA